MTGWEEQASRWCENLSEILNPEISKEEENEALSVINGDNCYLSIEAPTEAELKKAVRQITTRRAQGADNIPL